MTQKKPAVFFDRDGVLNVDHGYTYRLQDFKWTRGAIATIKFFNDHNYQVFVITNQSGIARGYYTEQDVQRLHQFMNEELEKQGAHIDAFYYCPHHVAGIVEKYRKTCSCRKPAPGMMQQAIREWDIDPARSFMIGDKVTDVQAAEAAGLRGYLFDDTDLYSFMCKKILISGT